MNKIKLISLFILAAFLFYFIGKSVFYTNTPYERNGKIVHPEYRKDFHRYSDSFERYSLINNECGVELRKYYFKKSNEAYRKIYPQGNPFDEPEEKITDTTCYPIQNITN